jgi:hypothetical protein
MMHTAELDMANTADPGDVADFLNDAAWAVCSTYHTVLKASPGAAIFGQDMLFDVPFLADSNKVGDYMQRQTDCNTARENKTRVEWDYAVCDKILVRKEVFSANQNASMKRNLGLSVKFIRMERSGFNAVLIQRDSTSGGFHLFLRKLKLNKIIT